MKLFGFSFLLLFRFETHANLVHSGVRTKVFHSININIMVYDDDWIERTYLFRDSPTRSSGDLDVLVYISKTINRLGIKIGLVFPEICVDQDTYTNDFCIEALINYHNIYLNISRFREY